jgi:formate dehydrogenase alpha subunit
LEEKIKLTIDGTEVEVPKGYTVLKAAEEAGGFIPTLCYDADLKPFGACRMCVVEIDGMRGTPTACTLPAANGMVVHTDSPTLTRSRLTAVQLLRSDHPTDCNACPKNQQCELQMSETVLGLAIGETKYHTVTRDIPIDSSNPFFTLDRSYCILCGKCIRTCDELCNISALSFAGRGFDRHVAAFGDKKMVESNCVSCGECVDNCPVFSLSPKEHKTMNREVNSVCPYCGVGCGIKIGVKADEITGTRGRDDNSVNNGHLCVRGRFSVADMVQSKERVRNPKVNGSDVSWDEAIEFVGTKLAGYKPSEIGVVASTKTPNEDNYVLQKFARAALGTNNVAGISGLNLSPAHGLAKSFGSGAMTNSVNEIVLAAGMMVVGNDMTSSQPIIAREVKRAARNGRKLIVINPYEIDLVRFSNMWLRNKPGTDAALLGAMAKVIIDEGLADKAFIGASTEGFDAFKDSVKGFDTASVEKITGVPAADIVAAARMWASFKPGMIFYGEGVNGKNNADAVNALAGLAMMTGNVGKAGAGVNQMLSANNELGAADMGIMPDTLPGYVPIADAAGRKKFEDAWGCTLDGKAGMTLDGMIAAAAKGEIKAMYIMGENPVLSEPDATATKAALSKLDFLLVQDMFMSETAKLATVVLPAASFAERDGTFTSTERRVQKVRRSMDVFGRSLPDWMITQRIAQQMGKKGFDFSDAAAIMAEIAKLVPMYGGISHDRLDSTTILRPCTSADDPGTETLYVSGFKGKFHTVKYQAPAEQPDAAFPFAFITGQNPFHLHTGTRTRRVKGLVTLRPNDPIEMNPEDALKLGLTDGGAVKVSSKRATISGKVKFTESVAAGTVYMTHHFADNPANALTGNQSGCAVKVEKA